MQNSRQDSLHNLEVYQIHERLSVLTQKQRFELIKIQDDEQATALLYAKGPQEINAFLDDLSPDQRFELIQIQDESGRTALHWADTPEEIAALTKDLSPDQRIALIKIKSNNGHTALDVLESYTITALLEGLSEDECLKIVPNALKKTTTPDHAIALTSQFNTPSKMGQALFTEAGEYRLDLSEPEADTNIFQDITGKIPDSREKEKLKDKFFAAVQAEIVRQAQNQVDIIRKKLSFSLEPTPAGQS